MDRANIADWSRLIRNDPSVTESVTPCHNPWPMFLWHFGADICDTGWWSKKRPSLQLKKVFFLLTEIFTWCQCYRRHKCLVCIWGLLPPVEALGGIRGWISAPSPRHQQPRWQRKFRKVQSFHPILLHALEQDIESIKFFNQYFQQSWLCLEHC